MHGISHLQFSISYIIMEQFAEKYIAETIVKTKLGGALNGADVLLLSYGKWV